jgi:hypothetical protein
LLIASLIGYPIICPSEVQEQVLQEFPLFLLADSFAETYLVLLLLSF